MFKTKKSQDEPKKPNSRSTTPNIERSKKDDKIEAPQRLRDESSEAEHSTSTSGSDRVAQSSSAGRASPPGPFGPPADRRISLSPSTSDDERPEPKKTPLSNDSDQEDAFALGSAVLEEKRASDKGGFGKLGDDSKEKKKGQVKDAKKSEESKKSESKKSSFWKKKTDKDEEKSKKKEDSTSSKKEKAEVKKSSSFVGDKEIDEEQDDVLRGAEELKSSGKIGSGKVKSEDKKKEDKKRKKESKDDKKKSSSSTFKQMDDDDDLSDGDGEQGELQADDVAIVDPGMTSKIHISTRRDSGKKLSTIEAKADKKETPSSPQAPWYRFGGAGTKEVPKKGLSTSGSYGRTLEEKERAANASPVPARHWCTESGLDQATFEQITQYFARGNNRIDNENRARLMGLPRGVRVAPGANVRLDADSSLGPDVHIGLFSYINGHVQIDDDVTVGPQCSITSNTHLFNTEHQNFKALNDSKPIHIKRGAWIAAGVTITAGVTIGECVLVCAGAVVTKDVPDYSIVAGIPAKVVGSIDPATGEKSWATS